MAKQAKTFKGSQDIHGVIGVRGTSAGGSTIFSSKTSSSTKKETSRPTKVYKKAPKSFDGVDGEQRLIDAGKVKYLYSKINGTWLKTKLSKPNESDESVATTTTESTSGQGGGGITSNSAKAIVFNFYYDDGDGSDYLEGWSSYLDACKETEPSGYTGTSKTDAAHNGLADGSFMRDSTITTSSLIIPVGLSNSGHGVKYFSTETIDGNSGDTGKKLFALDYQAKITQVRSRIPNTISVTETGTTSATQITVAMAGNTQITESIRLYWKLNSAGSYGANDYVTINTSSDMQSSWSGTYVFNSSNAGLTPSASTAYKFKTEPRNTASQQNVGTATESEVITTPSNAGSWSNIPNDFTMTASGEGSTSGAYTHANRTVTLTNGDTGTNSTTVSWTKDSGSVFSPGFAISKDGSPGTSGLANGGTGWNNGVNASKTIDLGDASATLYISFRHQYKGTYIGLDANMSVTFSNTNGSVADNTDLDITMENEEGFSP